ncbi:ATP-dependent RecD-like DNA helicase [Limosilactobacillus reuteri]|nr:ATP-dependent RecD-like DNA helicase [Limosilactobacillus reuteri]
MTLNIHEVISGEVKTDEWGYVVLKGNMTFNQHTEYLIKCEFKDDPKYGPQYNYIFSKRSMLVEDMEIGEFNIFLTEITPFAKVISQKFDDPRVIFKNHDTKKLTTIKGIGPSIAKRLFDLYESQKDYSPAYLAFGQWGFSLSLTRKIVNSLRSVDAAIKWLKEDPYYFIKVKGIGFKTIDSKALEHGIKVNDERRVRAFIGHTIQEMENDGDSWIYLDDLAHFLKKEIFNIDIEKTIEWLKSSKDYVVYSREDKLAVASRKLFDIEKGTVHELFRLLNKPSSNEIKDVDQVIDHVENDQGWKYSDSQNQAIHKILGQKVTLLNGKGGTGKTSILSAVLKVFKANDMSVATCALSGKAADNLTQITGKRGSTIHRLLGFDFDGFGFNKDNPLPYDVIVLDEVSMVNVELFYSLIQAIKSEAVLIMVGDSAQLDSIGVGVMRGILSTDVVPTVTLTKIHRQAENSAIVKHSLAYRAGQRPADLTMQSWKKYGVNNDMGYVFEDTDGETKKVITDAIKLFKASLAKYKVQDIQILCPTIINCGKLNQFAQTIANPYDESKEEYTVNAGKDNEYTLRVGDKVINTRNNYDTTDPNGEKSRPIFNGNTGTVTTIEVETNSKGNVKRVNTVIDFDGIGKVGLSDGELQAIQLGYAITVHKSQGSTIPCVIVALPFQYKLNSRELLYTAITRASKDAFLVTSPRTLTATIKKSSEKKHRDNLGALLKAYTKEAR